MMNDERMMHDGWTQNDNWFLMMKSVSWLWLIWWLPLEDVSNISSLMTLIGVSSKTIYIYCICTYIIYIYIYIHPHFLTDMTECQQVNKLSFLNPLSGIEAPYSTLRIRLSCALGWYTSCIYFMVAIPNIYIYIIIYIRTLDIDNEKVMIKIHDVTMHRCICIYIYIYIYALVT